MWRATLVQQGKIGGTKEYVKEGEGQRRGPVELQSCLSLAHKAEVELEVLVCKEVCNMCKDGMMVWW